MMVPTNERFGSAVGVVAVRVGFAWEISEEVERDEGIELTEVAGLFAVCA